MPIGNPGYVQGSEILPRNFFIERKMQQAVADPKSLAKGALTGPFTFAPDVIGMGIRGAGWGINSLRRAMGLPEKEFVGENFSGDPIRRAVGLDPESPAGQMGEFIDPTKSAAKGAGLLAETIARNAPELAHAAKGIGEGLLGMTLFHGTPPYKSLTDIPASLEKKYKGLELDISDSSKLYGEPVFELDTLVIPEASRGGGIGTQVMRDITKQADSQGAIIILKPDSSVSGMRGSKAKDKQLVEFYKRHGFVENKGRNKDFRFGGPTQGTVMYRVPKSGV